MSSSKDSNVQILDFYLVVTVVVTVVATVVVVIKVVSIVVVSDLGVVAFSIRCWTVFFRHLLS